MGASISKLTRLALVVSASTRLFGAPLISNINPDQSAYPTNAGATIWLDLQNNTATTFNGTAECSISHLGSAVANLAPIGVANLAPGGTTTKAWSWATPPGDFQGYLVSITMRNQTGVVVDAGCTAIDVSTDWAKFPRYGFVTRYDLGIDTFNLMWQLKNYHINAVQFYDWQWKHHLPYSGSSSWFDIANRVIQGTTVSSLIAAVHSYNMAAMNYNLYGGAYDNYWVDGSGVELAMGIFSSPRPAGGYSLAQQLTFAMPQGWATTRLYEMNNRDTNWQNYIFAREQQVFTNYAFDGWHIDSLGVRHACDFAGEYFSLDDYNPDFINNARAALGKRMVFNTVDAGGETQVSQSANVEFVYSELWGANPDYIDFNRRVDNVRKYSSKPVVFAAYVNRGLTSGYFNEAAVRLADAAIFAAGASHLELGDGDRMLHTEYFPDNGSVRMSSSLQATMRTYYDFLVGYENLLRDYTITAQNPAAIAGLATSTNGRAGTVWLLSKKTLGYNILHCINLLNNSSSAWRDNYGTNRFPSTYTQLSLKMYYSGDLAGGKLRYATPDYNSGAATELSYTNGADAVGNYVETTLPRLQYWDMLWLEMKGAQSAAEKCYTTNYDSMGGVSSEPTGDVGGGLDVCSLNNTPEGAYAAFSNVDFGSGCSNVFARVASAVKGSTLEFRLDAPTGALIAAVPVGDTGGLQNWQTITCPVTGASGVRHLFVLFKNAPSSLHWFQFSLFPYEQPILTAVPATNGPMSLLISGGAARVCVILASTNLTDWEPVFSTMRPTLPFMWTDPESTSRSIRFYRVRLGP